jgi:hypothetical protein
VCSGGRTAKRLAAGWLAGGEVPSPAGGACISAARMGGAAHGSPSPGVRPYRSIKGRTPGGKQLDSGVGAGKILTPPDRPMDSLWEVKKCSVGCAGRFYLYKSVNRSLVVMPKWPPPMAHVRVYVMTWHCRRVIVFHGGGALVPESMASTGVGAVGVRWLGIRAGGPRHSSCRLPRGDGRVGRAPSGRRGPYPHLTTRGVAGPSLHRRGLCGRSRGGAARGRSTAACRAFQEGGPTFFLHLLYCRLSV